MSRSPFISADSHVVEPPWLFDEYLERRWQDVAPRLVEDGFGGQAYQIHGTTRLVGLGLSGSAGVGSENLSEVGIRFSSIRPGAYDVAARVVDQMADSLDSEVLFPTLGLFLLPHLDRSYSSACLRAYNRWLADLVAQSSGRLIGCGVLACESLDAAVEDMGRIRAAGLAGALLPLQPVSGGYGDPEFDMLWASAVEFDLPIVFHATPPTMSAPNAAGAETALTTVWEAQAALTALLMGGVFQRWPGLRVVFNEFDASWAPHLLQRLDHYDRLHNRWLKSGRDREGAPSEDASRCVWFGFQDDALAINLSSLAPGLNLLWGSDFPHAESTWPLSAQLRARARATLGVAADAVFGLSAASLFRVT